MKTSSRLAIGGIVALVVVLLVGYRSTRTEPEAFTRDKAVALAQSLQNAIDTKNVSGLFSMVSSSPDAKIMDKRSEQMRLLVGKAFQNTGKLNSKIDDVQSTSSSDSDAQVTFHAVVREEAKDANTDYYNGNVTLRLRREEVSRLFGLVKNQEWRIVGVETDGRSPVDFNE